MAMTLAGIVSAACNEIGYDPPSSIVGNSDPDAQQFLALANASGEDLLSAHDWSFLTIEGATITLVAGQEIYALPNDFDRLVAETQWDRTNRWQTMGPDDPQDARWRRESVTSLGPRRAIRQIGASISVWPVPGASGDIISFDYVSNAWASGGALTSAFVADTDTVLFRPRLMIMDLKWRWRAAKGLEATALQVEFQTEKKKAIARDMGGGRVLQMGGRRMRRRANADDVVAAGPTVVLGTTGGDGIAID